VTERQMAEGESRNSWTLFMEVLAFFHCYHHMIWYICWSQIRNNQSYVFSIALAHTLTVFPQKCLLLYANVITEC